jgi:hypothetical protein
MLIRYLTDIPSGRLCNHNAVPIPMNVPDGHIEIGETGERFGRHWAGQYIAADQDHVHIG